ncbi:MAG: manganese efflux pump [Bacilli bacterium]
MNFILLLPIIWAGIGLSMDAFSLAILYGTVGLTRHKAILLSLIVGIFHFFMPLLGYYFGKTLLTLISINSSVLIGIIFVIISIQMFLSLTKDEEVMPLTSLTSFLIFAFTVSIDSFSIGIGLSALNSSIYLSSSVFAVLSASFTLVGLTLGKKLSKIFGNISILIGSIILLLLGVYYFFT